eukprot:COSAG04_NODE_6796_length_1253_cov_5.317308_2_plen_155_part_00
MRSFFTSCISSGVMGVEDLSGYRALYESCQNMEGQEKGVLVSNLNSLVEDATCIVDTSSITSAGAQDGALPASASGQCTDDDAEVVKIFGEGFSCVSAAASQMCSLIIANSPRACTCSCPMDGSESVCTNNDARSWRSAPTMPSSAARATRAWC